MFRKILPPFLYKTLKPIFKTLHFLYLAALDYIDNLVGKKDFLIPPRTKIFIGGGDFRQTGLDFLKLFTTIAHLRPCEHVLDIGCGIGRMAIPLTTFLDENGTYDGFDIVKEGIDWCNLNIKPKFPKFNFQVADIHNDHYNPQGSQKGAEYTFPFESNSFDFVFLTSVFTHMPKPEVDRYVAEIGRVLKPGGRCLVTFFLLNDESRVLMKSSGSAHNIQYFIEGRYIAYPDDPEVCVGFAEEYIRTLFENNCMKVAFYPGSWCGRELFTTFQDIVIAYKE